MFNVFISNQAGRTIATLSQSEAYNASAIANWAADAGYRVATDLWDAVVPDAMLTPAMHTLVQAATPQPVYTLRYTIAAGLVEKTLTRAAMDKVTPVVARAADRGAVWNIEVIDENGNDITFDFAAFAA